VSKDHAVPGVTASLTSIFILHVVRIAPSNTMPRDARLTWINRPREAPATSRPNPRLMSIKGRRHGKADHPVSGRGRKGLACHAVDSLPNLDPRRRPQDGLPARRKRMSSPALPIRLAPLVRPADCPEIVERKGIGHPDTICDAIAEEFSLALVRFYRERFGLILHHNVDKVLLRGGASRAAFGG
jgi:hypothetical protein